MSDLSATNCGCGCDDGRRGNGCGCGNDCGFAVADVAMAVADMAMTVACGSSYYSSAAVDSAMVAADVAVAMTAVSSHLSKQLRRLFYKVKMREIRLNLPRLLTYYFSSVSK